MVGALFALWGLWIGLTPISDNGFLTHLATGRLILDGGIPSTDPYSFTAAGSDWVVQSWLASVVYAAADRLWDGAGLRLLMGLLTAAIAVLAWRLTRPAGSLMARIAVVGLVVGVGTAMWSPRPLLFGLVFLGITLLVVEERRAPWLLVPVFWLWVNTHGSFPLGLVALGCLAVGRRLDGDKPAVELRALAWAAAGTVVAVINPLGLRLLTFPLHMLERQELLSQIIEWQSPAFDSTWARLFLVQVVVAIAALVRRPTWRAAVPLLVFLPAALLAARNIPVASIVLIPGMAHGLEGLGSLDGLRRSKAAAVAMVVIALGALLLASTRLAEPDYDLSDFPVDAVAYLDRNQLVGPSGTRIAAADTVGNYLELLYGRDANVFLDDRLDMYPAWVVDDYMTLHHGAPGWSGVLDRDDIDVVLWPRDEPLASLLAGDPSWNLRYADEKWVVFGRQTSSTQD